MSSEKLGSAKELLKGNLGGSWDILEGSEGNYTDLGIARRFGGAAAAYSLRDIGAMNGSVVRVRREPHDNDGVTTPSVEDETDFSANQVASGALEDWVNGKLETDLPASVNYERAVKVTISHSLIDSGNTKTLTMFVGASNDGNTHENGFLRYYGYIGSTAYKLYNSPSAVNWRFRLESSPNTDYAVSSNNAIPENVTDVPSWENGDDGGTLNSFSVVAATPAAAAYSLRKVKASYGIPNTVVNGTENFPATVPSSGSPADIGNGFTAHKFSDGVADSESVTVSGGTITVTAIASGTGSFSAGCRLKGLADGKQYTVSGEFRVTSQGADGGGVALVDISDDTAGTDEDSITTSSTTFTPFFIDAGYNGGSNDNFVDLQANSSGSNSGTLTAEFRNVQIIENNNSAVRIRRSSDDEEVVVGFDSDNKVSASSPVTATPSGSTTATDLNGFLNESDVDVGMGANFFSQYPQANISGTSPTGFTATIAKTNAQDIDIRAGSQSYKNVKKGTITVSFTVKQNTFSNSVSVSLWQLVSGQGYKTVGNIPTGSTGAFSFTFENTDTAGQIFRFVTNSNSVNDGEVLQVSDITIKASKHTATVHTWYDQAGSNNAVQATAGKQPKIAESGALLADGIDFDGTDDYLDFSEDICDNINSFSAFVQAKSDGFSGGSGQIIFSTGFSGNNNIIALGRGSTHSRISYGNNSYDIATADALENGCLLSIIAGSSTVKGFNNAVEGTSQSSISDNPLESGGLGAHNGSGSFFDGKIKEAIFYKSDQSDNRFKIESNINNYYGLYNDANEMAEPWTSPDATVTNESKDGFTVTNPASGDYVAFELAIPAPHLTPSRIRVSFMADDPDDALNNISCRTSANGPSGSLLTINNGFNSIDINNNVGTGNTTTHLNIQFNAGTKTATISNFKISRIARNGFVETWYDQSGNGRPLIQASASEQPSIVENGGFLGGVKADVATSNDTMQNLQVSTDGTNANFGTDDWANGGTKLGLMYVGSIIDTAATSSTCVILGGGRGVSSFQTGGLSLQIIKGGTDSWRLANERQGLSPSAMTTAVSLNSDNDVILYGITDNRDFTIKVNASSNAETESADLDTREGAPISLFGAYDKNSNRYYQRSSSGVCKECYLFSGDNITEVDTISTEINKHYNIY